MEFLKPDFVKPFDNASSDQQEMSKLKCNEVLNNGNMEHEKYKECRTLMDNNNNNFDDGITKMQDIGKNNGGKKYSSTRRRKTRSSTRRRRKKRTHKRGNNKRKVSNKK